MRYSIFAFLITLGQLVVVLVSYAMQSQNVFSHALIYGSPFYLIMNLLGEESALLDANLLYISLLVYHVFKYFLIFRAQIANGRNMFKYGAIIFEAAYLCISGYYLN